MAVELRLSEKRAGELKDLVGLSQLLDLSLQRLDALLLGAGRASWLSAATLVFAHPAAQSFSCTADFGGNRADRRPLRFVFALMLQHHAHCALVNLGGKIY